jgi:uncharacterized membrane protein YhaH (DUF805 family)
MADLVQIYCSPQGRLRRLPYFLYGLVMGFVCVIPQIVLKVMEMQQEVPDPELLGPAGVILGILALIFALISIYCGVILGIKRLHDLDKSGWFLLILFIPIIGLLMVIYLLFFPGTPGPNRFGPPPV